MNELVQALMVVGEDWRDRAACIGIDPELFFTERGDNHTLTEAKAICQGCAVQRECLDFALVNVEKWGVWGGYSERERRRMRRERGISDLRIAG